MRRPVLRQGLLLIALVLAFFPVPSAAADVLGPAPQKGGVLIYQWGDEFFAAGPLPPSLADDPGLAGHQAGYLCQTKGVFWSDFSVKDCSPVAFQGDTYYAEPEITTAISAAYPQSAMQRTWWNHYGWIVLAGVAVLFLLFKVLLGRKDRSAADEG